MRYSIAITACALLATGSVGLSACSKIEHPGQGQTANSARTPDQVRIDLAKAAREAAESNARADKSSRQAEAQAREELAKEKAQAEAKAADKSVVALADAAVTQAEGTTKIALAKCEALDGDAQRQCRDEANAHLQTVKERARAAKKGPLGR